MAQRERETVTLTRTCNAGIERVFSAWTEPADMKHWWTPNRDWVIGRIQVDPRPAGSLRVEFGPAGESPLVEEGDYLEFDPPDRIVYTELVTRDGETIHGPAPCTVTFRELDPGRSEVRVVSTLDLDEGPEGRTRGWGAALDGLVDLFRKG